MWQLLFGCILPEHFSASRGWEAFFPISPAPLCYEPLLPHICVFHQSFPAPLSSQCCHLWTTISTIKWSNQRKKRISCLTCDGAECWPFAPKVQRLFDLRHSSLCDLAVLSLPFLGIIVALAKPGCVNRLISQRSFWHVTEGQKAEV